MLSYIPTYKDESSAHGRCELEARRSVHPCLLYTSRALEIAVAAFTACRLIGVPECNVHLTEAVIYMALAPKSNAMETAYLTARKDALEHLAEPVPLVIRNAPTLSLIHI